MRRNPHHELLGKELVLDVYKSCGLTFADDKIVDEMITVAWFYDDTKLRLRERTKDVIKNNPRHALIEEAFCELKKKIETALAKALEKKRKENKK